jgi:TonB family protein
MNTRRLFVSLATLALVLALPLSRAEKPASAKPGYTVVVEVKVDEKGLPEDAQVFSSDDTTLDHILDRTALGMAKGIKLAPRVKDGHAVKYTVRAPFVFPVEGDEGAEANNSPKPKLSQAVQPVYPADQAAKGTVGGAILEAVIGADGKVSSLMILRSSDPAFELAATTAVKQWVFVPAQKDGVPVESRWRMSICFETDVQVTDWTWRVAPRPSLGSYTVVHRTLPPEPPAAETKPATPPPEK